MHFSAAESIDDEQRRLHDIEMQEQNKHWSVGVIPQGKGSLQNFQFISSHPHNNVWSDSVSRLTPREFEETYIRVYARHKSQASAVRDVFQQVILIFY